MRQCSGGGMPGVVVWVLREDERRCSARGARDRQVDRPVQGDPSIGHKSTQAIGLRDESDAPATLSAVMVNMLLPLLLLDNGRRWLSAPVGRRSSSVVWPISYPAAWQKGCRPERAVIGGAVLIDTLRQFQRCKTSFTKIASCSMSSIIVQFIDACRAVAIVLRRCST